MPQVQILSLRPLQFFTADSHGLFGAGPFLDAAHAARYGRRMSRSAACFLLIAFAAVSFPNVSPAPLIYRPGEGWVYESVGSSGKWVRDRAEDQYNVAFEAFNNGDYSVAHKAARRVMAVWPLSDYSASAGYLLGRTYEAEGKDEKAFAIYQDLLEKHPKAVNYEEVLKRQFEIANRFLAGQWFRIWGVIPAFSSMEKTAEMYRKIIARGPHSEIAPTAQLSIGAAYEKRDKLTEAAAAYVMAADRYADQTGLAAEAMFRAAQMYRRQARKAEYDQGSAGDAITAFTVFIGLHPNDPRVGEAQETILELKTEQARGALEVARYYEKKQRPSAALVYYNEVIIKAPASSFADIARARIAELKKDSPSVAAPSPTASVPPAN
jgi:outer membrane protein assembly factor BamD (BamD/ComL family)